MAKTLIYTDSSPREMKQGDTDTVISMVISTDQAVVDATALTAIELRVKDSSGAITKYSLVPDETEGTMGTVNLQVDDAFAKLPLGVVSMEAWATTADAKQAIYPSEGMLTFELLSSLQV